MKTLTYSLILFFLFSCEKEPAAQTKAPVPNPSPQFSIKSDLLNTYLGFHSPDAINKLVEIETDYFTHSPAGLSKYYGTIWRQQLASKETAPEKETLFESYCDKLGQTPDSMHCTIYAVEALKAGLGENFEKLETLHRQTYGKHEHAGWSYPV